MHAHKLTRFRDVSPSTAESAFHMEISGAKKEPEDHKPDRNASEGRIVVVAPYPFFNHPAARQRDYVLQKLIAFHHQHQTPASQIQLDLQHVAAQLPPGEHAAEAKPLQEELNRIQDKPAWPAASGRDSSSDAGIAWRGRNTISAVRGQRSHVKPTGRSEPRTSIDPKAQSLRKSLTLSRITNA